MATLCLAIHEDRCSSVFADFSPSSRTSISQTLLSIVHDELFAKGIDEVFGATGDDKLIGIRAREAHSVANNIAPQTATRGDYHSIVNACLHSFEWNNRWIVGAKLIHWNEFIEHIIVGHQQKTLILRIALNAKEAFAGIIRLHVVHLWVRDEHLILRSIRCKRNATMKENFEVWPHFFKVFLAR